MQGSDRETMRRMEKENIDGVFDLFLSEAVAVRSSCMASALSGSLASAEQTWP